MDKATLHKLIDEVWDKFEPQAEPPILNKPTADTPELLSVQPPVATAPEPPKDKIVVRTKTTLDKVYLIDKVKNTRQWVTNPKVLEGLGFTFADVKEMPDAEFMKYTQAPALYQVPANAATPTT